MLSSHGTSHRPRRVALAIALVLTVTAALPALTPAKVGLRLGAAPDKAAPAGRTPKVVFSLLGAAKGQRYRIEAKQVSGQNPNNVQGYPVVCASVLGRYSYTKANTSKLVFDPSPLTSYELGSGSPCTGTYKGKVFMPRPGNNVAKVVMTFKLQVPAMRLTHVTVLSG